MMQYVLLIHSMGGGIIFLSKIFDKLLSATVGPFWEFHTDILQVLIKYSPLQEEQYHTLNKV